MKERHFLYRLARQFAIPSKANRCLSAPLFVLVAFGISVLGLSPRGWPTEGSLDTPAPEPNAETSSASPEMVVRVFRLSPETFSDVSQIVTNIKSPEGLQWNIPSQNKIIVKDHPEFLDRIEETLQKQEEAPPVTKHAVAAPQPTPETRSELDRVIKEFHCDGESVRDALWRLAAEGNLSIILSGEVPDIPITVRLNNLTVRQILQIITQNAGLRYHIEPDTSMIEFSTPDGSGARLEPDVEDGEGLGIDTTVEIFVVQNRPIRDVLNMLAEYSDVNFSLSPAVPEIPITARLHGLTVRQILDRILADAHLDWKRDPAQDLICVLTLEETRLPVHPERPFLITRVFRIQHTSMHVVSPIVQQLSSAEGAQYHVPTQRKIIVKDTPDVVAEIEAMLAELDVPPEERR